MAFSSDPASILASQGVMIKSTPPEEQRRRGVTDMITLSLCARYAHHFSQQRYPAQTPATVLGHILHRTIKHLHDRYQAERRAGESFWLPGESEIRDECRIASEAARAQGLPALSADQESRLERMLCAFHALEAPTFYPRIKAAEVDLCWLWDNAPGGPLLLDGKVDVVVVENGDGEMGLALWDYKTAKKPQGGAELYAYTMQIQLYALLYHRCFGIRPRESVLYFMGELASPRPLRKRPPDAIVRVPMAAQTDAETMAWLCSVMEKEYQCLQNVRWEPPVADDVPQRMCRTCQIRWSCSSFHEPLPWRRRVGNAQSDDLEVFDS
jgi:hypothetical protein